MQNMGTASIWVAFTLFIVLALWLDSIVANKKPKISPSASMKMALSWSLFWISLAFLFNLILWGYLYQTTTPEIAHQKALDFLAGYLIEKSLSVDNLFAFYMIFHQFHIPSNYQRRIFAYGIWGAVFFRLFFILFGTYLINQYHFIIYFMGAFLIATGVQMFFFDKGEGDLSNSVTYRIIKKVFRVTDELQGQAFFIKQGTKWIATRLFVALIFIELSDIVFAFDSIPAIFAITRDPFIVWSSNIFAILGLRALYFLLAGMAEKFRLLKFGVAIILVFVGLKMLLEHWIQVSTIFSLGVIISVLTSFILISVFYRPHINRKI